MAAKLTKKISFTRAKKLNEFKEIQEKYNEITIKENEQQKKRGVSKTKDLSELSYYVVVEYHNLSDKIDYDKIFPNDNFVVDFEALLNEQEKIMDHINNKKKSGYPKVYDKMGLINKVTGCYLVATTKGVNSIRTKNTMNNLSVKLKEDSLPVEVNTLCEDFYSLEQHNINRDKEEFERFVYLNFEEQDIILQNILQNIRFDDNKIIISEDNQEKDEENDSWSFSGKSEVYEMHDITSENIKNINSVKYLKNLLKKFEKDENYEVCAKIRDRISYLKEG